MPESTPRRSAIMRRMVLDQPGMALRMEESAIPEPKPGQVLLEVSACAVCDIDPQILEGEIPGGRYPLVPGHEAVGHVRSVGDGVQFKPGQRVGVAWLGGSCGQCAYCKADMDHLCSEQRHTGLHLNGGYATHVLADARHCFAMDKVRVEKAPDYSPDSGAWSQEAAMAPLLCEGALAFRSYERCRKAGRIGLYGFGTAAQLVCQLAKAEGQEIYAMTRPGGEPLLEVAQALGAHWTGTIEQMPPAPLDAAILLQPTVELVPHALSAVRRNGALVFLGMHASHVPAFPYDLFMYEHSIHSISRSSRTNMLEFLERCSEMPLKTRFKTYPLDQADAAVRERVGAKHGETVLVMQELSPGSDR